MVTSYIKTLNKNNEKSLDQEITVIMDGTLIASNSPSAAALAIVTDPDIVKSTIELFTTMGIALMPGDTIIIPATAATIGGVYILYRGGKFIASILKERKSNIQEQVHKTLTDIPEEPKLESFPLGEEKNGEVLVTPNAPLEGEQEYIPNTTPQRNEPESIPLNDGNIDEKRYIFTVEERGEIEIHNPVLDAGYNKKVVKDRTKKISDKKNTNQNLKKGDYHDFNDIVDNYAGDGKETLLPHKDNNGKIIGYDRKIELEVTITDSKGKIKKGTFEWIIDVNGGINHRFFREDR